MSTRALRRVQYVTAVSASQVDPKTFEDEQVVHYSIPAIQETGGPAHEAASAIDSNKLLLKGGEVLVSRLNPHKNTVTRVNQHEEPILCSTEFVAFEPVRIEPRFLEYLFRSESTIQYLTSLAASATRSHSRVDPADIIKLKVLDFSESEQRLIADYLDAETTRIDGLIAEKEQFLSLLEEKRASIVTRAVTRGLDSRVRMKPSGLEWTREVPAHWRIMRLKHFTQIGNGSTPNVDNFEYWQGGDIPWLNSSVVGDRPVKEPSRLVTELALRECHLPIISPPVVLVAITGQGKTRGRSTVLEFEATINQHLAFMKPEPGAAECMYLSLLLDAAYTFLRSDSDGAGSTRGAITCEQLGNFRVPVPPINEQRSILSHIDESVRHSTEVETATADSIALLRERRSAVITAAVTGAFPLEGMT